MIALLREDGCDVDAFEELLRFNAFAVMLRYEALQEESPFFERERVIEEIDTLLTHVAQRLE